MRLSKRCKNSKLIKSMELNKLPKITKRSKKRLGRGLGGGRGKTSGRGTKGQRARGKIKLGYEGGQLPLIKRLPFLRGKSRNISLKHKPVIINVKFLNLLPAKTEVDIKTLVKYGILKEEAVGFGVKILGEGDLTKSLIVKLPSSKGARKKIEAAGGKIELQ